MVAAASIPSIFGIFTSIDQVRTQLAGLRDGLLAVAASPATT